MNLLNVFMVSVNFAGNLKKNLVFSLKKPGFSEVKKLISAIFLVKSSGIRCEILRFLYVLFFNCNEIFDFLGIQQENVRFKGYLPMKTEYFSMVQGDFLDKNSQKSGFWQDFYPINEFAKEYLAKTMDFPIFCEENNVYNEIIEKNAEEFMRRFEGISRNERNEGFLENFEKFASFYKAFPEKMLGRKLGFEFAENAIRLLNSVFLQFFNENAVLRGFSCIRKILKTNAKSCEISLDEIIAFIVNQMLPYFLEVFFKKKNRIFRVFFDFFLGTFGRHSAEKSELLWVLGGFSCNLKKF